MTDNNQVILSILNKLLEGVNNSESFLKEKMNLVMKSTEKFTCAWGEEYNSLSSQITETLAQKAILQKAINQYEEELKKQSNSEQPSTSKEPEKLNGIGLGLQEDGIPVFTCGCVAEKECLFGEADPQNKYGHCYYEWRERCRSMDAKIDFMHKADELFQKAKKSSPKAEESPKVEQTSSTSLNTESPLFKGERLSAIDSLKFSSKPNNSPTENKSEKVCDCKIKKDSVLLNIVDKRLVELTTRYKEIFDILLKRIGHEVTDERNYLTEYKTLNDKIDILTSILTEYKAALKSIDSEHFDVTV